VDGFLANGGSQPHRGLPVQATLNGSWPTTADKQGQYMRHSRSTAPGEDPARGPGGLVAQKTSTDDLYYLADGLGSTMAITDDTGDVVRIHTLGAMEV